MAKEPKTKRRMVGRAEMSLIESALCPLNARAGVPLEHESRFTFYDKNKHKKQARVTLEALKYGFTAHDEEVLWVLLEIGASQGEPTFYATRNYILRRLGLGQTKKGTFKPSGKDYQNLKGTLDRISRAHYSCDNFYDPIRGEHRGAEFGFVSFTYPLEEDTQRGWHFAINGNLWYYLEPANAIFRFDLETARSLDHAARRLFLLLKKIFQRNRLSPKWNLAELCVDTLGYAPTVAAKDLRVKLRKVCDQLTRVGMISEYRIEGRGANATVRFSRGDYLQRQVESRAKPQYQDLPIHELWQTIGVDEEGMGYLYRNHDMKLLQEWADITLCKLEKQGRGSFDRSPAAYYIDNVKKASSGDRYYPDWWLEERKQRERRERGYDKLERSCKDVSGEPTQKDFAAWLDSAEGRDCYRQALVDLLGGDKTSRKRVDDREAASARRLAKGHCWRTFSEQWEASGGGFQLN